MDNSSSIQRKQDEWAWQWDHIYDDNEWLFREWIQPITLEDFRGKDVLDCGCGGGQHINFVAPYAASVTGVDLNAIGSAQHNTKQHPHVTLIEDDLAKMNLGKQFDIVYCIGVIHHTDDPDLTFQNLLKHVKPGGKVIVWCYAKEGNFLNQYVLEPIKRAFIFSLPRKAVWWIGQILTALVYVPVYTIYLLPLRFLPFYEYFQNWRQLSFERNFLNVFDKLNAPQTHFITRERIGTWFNDRDFENIHISPYKGVSWRGSGTKKALA